MGMHPQQSDQGHLDMLRAKRCNNKDQETEDILTLNNGINGAALLAVSTVDALGHINVVSGGSSASIFTLFRLNRDSLGWADSLAKLAGNATLFTGWIAAEGVLSTESRGDGALLERVEDGVSG